MKCLFAARRRPRIAPSLIVALALLVLGNVPAHAQDPFDGGDDPFAPAAGDTADDPFGAAPAAKTEPRDTQPAEDRNRGPSKSVPVKHLYVWADDSEANRRLEQTLKSPLTEVGFDFTETPLEEIVEFLRDEYQIEVQIDIPALDELGLDPEEPITCNIRNVSLRAALRRMLGQLELTSIVTDEMLLVTTEEEAELQLRIAVYPVGDVLVDGDFAGLIDALIATVATESWAENGGGEAEIRPLAPALLVVSQTEAVHAEILKTLTAIRQARQTPQSQLSGASETSVVTRGYAVRPSTGQEHVAKVEQTAELLRRIVPLRPSLKTEKRDKAEAQFISVVGDQLIVRSTPGVHREVAKFLQDTGLNGKGGSFSGGGFGFGFGSGGGGSGGGGAFSAPATEE